MKKRILIIFSLWRRLPAAGVYAYHGVGRTPDNRIVVSGNIELTEVNIAFKTAGRLIERTVDEGDPVKKGQVVARLDRDQLTGAEATARRPGLNRRSRNSRRRRPRWSGSAPRWPRISSSGRAIWRQRGPAGRTAQRRRGRRRSWMPRRRWIRRKRNWNARKSDWDRAQTLYKNDDISTAQFDQYRNRWESAEAALKSAKEREALVLAGPRVEQINAPAGAGGAGARRAENGGSQRHRDQAAASRRSTTRRAEIARSKAIHRADRFADRRYDRGLAGGWRGAGEVGRRGRDTRAGNDGGDGGRHRPSVAARLRQRDAIWAR